MRRSKGTRRGAGFLVFCLLWLCPLLSAAEALPAGEVPLYTVLPLHGRFGVEISRAVFAECLAHIAEAPGSVLVLEIDSPGGASLEMEDMLDDLYAWREAHPAVRIVTLVRHQALNAAALFALAGGPVFIVGEATLGGQLSPPEALEEPFTWIEYRYPPRIPYRVRSLAEKNGIDPEFVTAMVPHSKTLCWVKDPDPPRLKIIQQGTKADELDCLFSVGSEELLQLAGGRAVELGLASTVVEDYEDLGRVLGPGGWRETNTGVRETAFRHAEQVQEALGAYESLAVTIYDRMGEFEIPEGLSLALAEEWVEEIAYCASAIQELLEVHPFLKAKIDTDFPEGIAAVKDICAPCLAIVAQAENNREAAATRENRVRQARSSPGRNPGRVRRG